MALTRPVDFLDSLFDTINFIGTVAMLQRCNQRKRPASGDAPGGIMRGRRMALLRGGLVVASLVTAMPADGSAWARVPGSPGPVLYIVADRIVGFVPFTVYLYGKVTGTEPGAIELCRSEVALMADMAEARPSVGGFGIGGPGGNGPGAAPAVGPARGAVPPTATCSSGQLSKGPDGYDFAQEARFEKAGTFQVRLSMVDTSGRKILSNPVQVKAL